MNDWQLIHHSNHSWCYKVSHIFVWRRQPSHNLIYTLFPFLNPIEIESFLKAPLVVIYQRWWRRQLQQRRHLLIFELDSFFSLQKRFTFQSQKWYHHCRCVVVTGVVSLLLLCWHCDGVIVGIVLSSSLCRHCCCVVVVGFLSLTWWNIASTPCRCCSKDLIIVHKLI